MESSRPENRGFRSLNQEGALHERYQHRQSAASPYDRRHGCAQAQPAHSAWPHLQLQSVRRLAQTLARYVSFCLSDLALRQTNGICRNEPITLTTIGTL